MKSVIINLKYLIFRSVSASEGGWLEEQQQRGRESDGGGGGGSAVASALSPSTALKSTPTKAEVQQWFSFFCIPPPHTKGWMVAKTTIPFQTNQDLV